MNATTRATYEPALPIADIAESKSNPRKHYDAKAIDELAASIREKGVLEPVLVRPNGHAGGGPGFELVFGHRRLRAAKLAGLDAVPATVRVDLDDQAVLEMQCIENLQRDDLHPLEEAEGYRRLLGSKGYDVAKVATKIGRSVKYVYDRVKLLQLVPEAQKLFLDGRFQAGHAILLARLKPEDQKRAIALDDDAYGPARADGLFQHDRGLPFDDEAIEKAARKDPYLAVKPVSVRELERWIERSVRFEPGHVDPVLFPETARTLEIVGRSKQKLVLITREYRAGDEVRQGGKERVFGEQSWERADGQEGSKTCERSRVGLVACGPGQGEAFLVCIDKERCAIHWAQWQKDRRKRQAAAGRGDDAGGKARMEHEEQERRRRERVAREESERHRWKKALPAILQAVAAAVKKAPTKATGLLGQIILGAFADHRYGVARPKEDRRLVPSGTTADDLVRHVAFLTLAQDTRRYDAASYFPKRARAFGVDVRKIVDEVSPPDKPQTSAKPAAKKAKQ